MVAEAYGFWSVHIAGSLVKDFIAICGGKVKAFIYMGKSCPKYLPMRLG